MLEKMIAKDEGTAEDKDISQVENSGVYRVGTDNDKVGHSAGTGETIEKITQTTAGDAGHWCPGLHVLSGRPEQVAEACCKKDGDAYIEEEKA